MQPVSCPPDRMGKLYFAPVTWPTVELVCSLPGTEHRLDQAISTNKQMTYEEGG